MSALTILSPAGWVGWFTCATAAALVPVVALWVLLQRFFLRKRVRRFLHSRGFLVCERCGYDLRGQVTPICPECGRPFAVVPKVT
jgi:hypothetical protein